ncbi:carboxypeptidase-like regulatory domain-containing protein [Fluviicola sp.]|uniref:carboxypeptidase-like regulatory domain-containing protein n=1 Tax=Fluviicola sp. TaxID=1917219 RepID=UPI0031D60869
MKAILTVLFCAFVSILIAQPTQTVRGTILDSESDFPVSGAHVFITLSDSSKLKTMTNVNGVFEFLNVPVGKHRLDVKSNIYENYSSSVDVNSGRQTVVEIKVKERISEVEEVVVVAQKPGEVKNEMAMVSAQQFSVEETERYAGSRGDPARMASNFAGVQGADDSRNDIVVRGNSPLGIVYKVEGIDIPNPSHFAISGSSGGPVSIINNKSLANSDFFMSAFPAEYGNSVSGIFDLKLRNGNYKQHEFTGQFGFLGTEVLAEGPLSKKSNASYLVMGRYSTLSLFQFMGIRIGTDAVPVYGDGAFKFNFPLKKGGQLSLWGIGGKSNIKILISEQTEYTTDLYGEGDRDQYFGTGMAVAGLTYKKSLSERTFLTTTFSGSIEDQHSHHDYLVRSLDTTYNGGQQTINIRVDSIYRIMGYSYKIAHYSGMFSINHKIGKQHVIKAGLNADFLTFNMIDSVLNTAGTAFINRWDYKGQGGVLVQPFFQWKYRIKENMDFTAGLHAQYYSFSNSLSPVEPRLGWKWAMKGNQKLFAGAGLHSQTQPYYIYTYHQFDANGNKVYQNKDMGFTKSMHSALGYEKNFKKGFQFRTEIYYQYLYQVPVTVTPSAFSIINQGSGFSRFFPDSLQNTGTGVNYGWELTLQKFFDKSFYILTTVSLYDSKYKGSDGITRNTSYNGLYTANVLFGKEFKLGKKHVLGLGGKVTVAGGKRYGYINLAETNLQKELIFSDSLFNERQFKDYFRADLKISWKMNARKVTHEIGLDLVNIFNTRNILGLAYAPDLANPNKEPLVEKTQLGFLPIFYYRISFKLASGKKE